jgi:hypothetical protein
MTFQGRMPVRFPPRFSLSGRPKTKKADVEEHPWVFHHVGLLVNGAPGTTELPFV